MILLTGPRSAEGTATVKFTTGQSKLRVESVSCGLDHMAAVISVDRGLVEHL